MSYWLRRVAAESGRSILDDGTLLGNRVLMKPADASDPSSAGGTPDNTPSQKSLSSRISMAMISSSRSMNFHLKVLPPINTAT
jgi:hypothetical protein